MKSIPFHMLHQKNSFRYSSVVLLLCCIALSGFAQKAVPELWGHRVHDEANVLLPKNIDYLENRLKAYEDSTSNQIAILIIPSLEGENLEAYSLRVAESWKLGQEKKDNGLLILVAVDDHKIRFEVGQGLEGVLTDALCSRIIRNTMAPEFRRDNYAAGLNDALDVIIFSIAGEYVEENESESFFSKNKILLIILACLLFLIPTVYSFIKEFRRPSVRSLSSPSNDSESTSSNWSVSSSSSSDSSSSNDSSFSGGGGSFGGGGASGSW